MKKKNWFAQNYSHLYKYSDSPDEITDEQWIECYDRMLRVEDIVRIRNEEINKTPNVLEKMISDQQSLSDKDLCDRYYNVLTKLVEICVEESAFNNIYKKVPTFDSKYCDYSELMNLTGYFVSNQDKSFIINRFDQYKYCQCFNKLDKLCDQLEMKKYDFGLKKVLGTFDSPFAKGDVIMDIFKSLVREKLEAKRNDDFLDECEIYIDVSYLDKEDMYETLMKLFINGVWAIENQEMIKVLQWMSTNRVMKEYLDDLFNILVFYHIRNGLRGLYEPPRNYQIKKLSHKEILR